MRRTNESDLRKKKTVDMPEIPKTCAECPFYYNRVYQCHNERGLITGLLALLYVPLYLIGVVA